MARAYGYSRCFGILTAALTIIVSASYATTATSSERTFATTDYFANQIVVLDYASPAFELAIPASVKDYRDIVSLRHPPEYPAIASHERPSLAAVRPSAVAGWRSGRVRRLASA